MPTKGAKRREWRSAPVQRGERERERALGPSFYMLFPPLGLPCVNWLSQGCCLFYLRSSLWSSDLPLFYFLGLFPSLSLSHRHFGLLFPILTTEQSGCHFLLQRVFLNQRSDPGLLHCWHILCHCAAWEAPCEEQHNLEKVVREELR